ncbi:Response regulator receiver domain-containing protein [Desulfocicer vacuolatum DSM 3385]|uniref:Response regulator receiver domain-containing protein n=1 Tax=Desulfocicer vacuolatum DSM 3385 TaxID=1121400 RepID=A0A1W2EH90_9BACT|nr:response regulator [Desulfocicer vacuolatum]SMD08812.1 Response regulator receiver domain-containing protein [Desulfocicer vacuolatum DSM 3385]
MVALKEKQSTVSSPHILIMEDDLNVARGLKMVLDEDGYDVDLRDTGYGALDAMGQYQYDLLMADLRLPDIDGMQVIKKVRATNPSTGIIAMTGYATNDLAVDAMKLGARDFIAKPFTQEQIKTVIDEALAANLAEMEAMERLPQAKKGIISIQKQEVLKILNRTSEDKKFKNRLLKTGNKALDGYTLSLDAKTAIAAGNLKWITENVGELNQKQLMYVFQCLEQRGAL